MHLRNLTIFCGLTLSTSLATAQCNNPFWSTQFSTAATGLNSPSMCATVFDPDGPGPLPPALYVGGYFQSAGGAPGTRGIARWDGQSWSSVGGGLGGTATYPYVGALRLFDADGQGPGLPLLVAVGAFTNIGGISAANAAAWNGTQWTALGQDIGFTSKLSSTVEYDPDGPGPLPRVLLVGGDFLEIAGNPCSIAQWNGQAWTAFPNNYDCRAMAIFDDDGPGPALPSLYIGVGGPPGLFKWNGSSMEVVGGGLSRSNADWCSALRVVDEDGPGPGRPALLVGGFFTQAGGLPANAIARWNGSQWSTMGPGVGTSGYSQVSDILAVDYTNGLGPPTIYAFGIGIDSGLLSDGLMLWHPTTQVWSHIGDVTYHNYSIVDRMVAFQGNDSRPSLYLTGSFPTINQAPSPYFARLRCDTCPANCDHSATTPLLTANDFQCFLNNFAAANPYANCDGSTSLPNLTANDFQCFLNAYANGCP